jgi:hypothetical protein
MSLAFIGLVLRNSVLARPEVAVAEVECTPGPRNRELRVTAVTTGTPRAK